jgi:type IV secretion system protein VirB4
MFWILTVTAIIVCVIYNTWRGESGMQREYRDKARGFADLLRYSVPIADGVMLGKGGELMAGFFYRGMDTNSATAQERNALAAKLNAALLRLGSGWMVHIDVFRGASIGYAGQGAFFEPVTRMMDEERRGQYQQEGKHFESVYGMVFTYAPPVLLESKAQQMMFEQSADLKLERRSIHDDALERFEAQIQDLGSQLSSVFEGISRMRCHEMEDPVEQETALVDDLMGYLHYCTTGIKQPISQPAAGLFADSIIGSQDFTGGNTPKIGEKHIRIVSIEGLPAQSFHGILGALDSLPVSYRWSTRFIFMEPNEGKSLLNSIRKKWRQKVRGMKDQFMNTQSGPVDEEAIGMTSDAQTAMAEATSGMVRYGHYTSVIVLMDSDLERLSNSLEICVKLIRNLSFAARIETVNAVEAYLGSLPGHGYENVRRPILHTMNLVHLFPTTATWAGLEVNPCPFYPPKSPPLLQAATSGNTPIRISLHVGDVGHTMIVGPTGAGKSTLLELIEAQHFRYDRARLYKFEKGYSSFVLCKAMGQPYYDIAGEDMDMAFCPLGQVDRPAERFWAEAYIETLLQLQDFHVLPQHRNTIREALVELGKASPDRRTMTDFTAGVQDQSIQVALKAYTLGGNNPLLDATEDSMRFGRFQVFEMEHLLQLGNKVAVPVLLYIFHCIERQLDGAPTLLVLDEAWLMLEHPMFMEKIREWLKVMRKANCAVVFATQSISDVGNSPIRDVLFESCPLKILLPNVEANSNEGMHEIYRRIGLNERQIELLALGVYKRDYYYMSPLGRRMFQLGLGPVCLSFVGASGKADVALARELIAAHGDNWVPQWLRHRAKKPETGGRILNEWATYLENEMKKAA